MSTLDLYQEETNLQQRQEQQLTSEISFGVMASEKTQCTPGKREPSSSHKFRAMHSFRSISSGFDPGALDVRVRTTSTAAVAGTFVLRAIRRRRSQHGGAALGWPRIMIRVAAAATTLWEVAANILVSRYSFFKCRVLDRSDIER